MQIGCLIWIYLFLLNHLLINNDGILKLLSNYTIIAFCFDNNTFLK